MRSYYYLTPGVAVIDMKDGNFLFKSDTLAVKLGGASTVFLVQHILPLLNGKNELNDVCALVEKIARDDLKQNLDKLVKAGVLRRIRSQILIKEKNLLHFLTIFWIQSAIPGKKLWISYPKQKLLF